MTKNEVAKQETTALSTNVLEMLEANAGAGTDTLANDDQTRVEIKIAQQTSPQLKQNNAKYIEGLKQGDMFNSSTGRIYGKEVKLAVVGVYKGLIVWGTLEDQSKVPPEEEVFEAANPKRYAQIMNESIVNDSNKRIWKGTKKVNTTYRVAVIVFNEDGTQEPAVIDCIKTRYKNGKQLNTLLSNIRFTDRNGMLRPAPSCLAMIKAEVVTASNGSNDWYELKFSRVMDDPQYLDDKGQFKAGYLAALLGETTFLKQSIISGAEKFALGNAEADEYDTADAATSFDGAGMEEVF